MIGSALEISASQFHIIRKNYSRLLSELQKLTSMKYCVHSSANYKVHRTVNSLSVLSAIKRFVFQILFCRKLIKGSARCPTFCHFKPFQNLCHVRLLRNGEMFL